MGQISDKEWSNLYSVTRITLTYSGKFSHSPISETYRLAPSVTWLLLALEYTLRVLI
jgi:hypothetical protein